MRIAYDVTPLSHPRTGVGNYILGALEGMAEIGGHELVAFGPVSIRGRKLLNETLAGVDVERRIVTASVRARDPTRVGATRQAAGRALRRHASTCSTSATGCARHSAAVSARRWSTTSAHSASRSACIARTVPMHAGTAEEARTADVVIVNSEFTANDVAERLGVARERIHVAYPGVAELFRPDGPSSFTDPFIFSTATSNWRKNLENLRARIRSARRGAAAGHAR